MKRLLLLLLLLPSIAWAQKPPINGVAGPTTSSQLQSIITDSVGRGHLSFGISPPFINVVDYGAKCDGATTDTIPIQNALNALPSFGGVVVFPTGTCLSGPLTVSNKVSIGLKGSGYGQTILALNSPGTLLSIGQVNFSNVSDITIALNGTPQGVANTSGIVVSGASGNTEFRRVIFSGFADDGLYLHGTLAVPLSGMKVFNCYFLGNGRYQFRSEYSNDFHYENNQYGEIAGTAHAAIGSYLLNSSAGTYFANYHWQNIIGFKAVNSDFNVYTHNRYEINDHEGAYISGGSYLTFSTNRAYSNSQTNNSTYDNVYIADVATLSFVDNKIFTWDATNSRWGVNFSGTSTGLTIKANQISGYSSSFGPIGISSGTAAGGAVGDLVLTASSSAALDASSTFYLGGNGSQSTESATYWLGARPYAVLYLYGASVGSPSSTNSYAYTLRDNGSSTAMVATTTAGNFQSAATVTSPQVLTSTNDRLDVMLETGPTVATTYHRVYAVLAEF